MNNDHSTAGEYQPDLMRLVRLACTRIGFIAGALFAYQDAELLTDEQLAAEVGVPVAQLKHLALAKFPLQKAISQPLQAMSRPICTN